MPAAAQELRGRSRWAVLLGLALGLAGCGLAAKSKTCNLKAKGLSGRGWNGQELAGGQLALIFLKGPSSVSADIGAYLEAQSIRAGFFVQGSAVEGQEKVLEEIRDQGHLLGNGSYRYQDLTQAEQPVLELRTTDALITPYVTGNLFLFYAPLKSFDDQTAAARYRSDLGLYIALFDFYIFQPLGTVAARASAWNRFTQLDRTEIGHQNFGETLLEKTDRFFGNREKGIVGTGIGFKKLFRTFHQSAKEEGIAQTLAELEQLCKDRRTNVLLVLKINNEIAKLMGNKPVMHTYSQLAARATVIAIGADISRIQDHRTVNDLGNEIHSHPYPPQ